ncbi:MAG: hypothetical protein WKF40_02305 [Thermoleophilaceae bacterium]
MPPRRSSSRCGRSAAAATSCAAPRALIRRRWCSTRWRPPRHAGHDVVIVDTAGRLHTQQNLMDELAKVRKVIERKFPGAPARDAAVDRRDHRPERPAPGAALSRGHPRHGHRADQARRHRQGGIALAIAQELGLPVKLIGIGEGIEDLRPFDPQDFARAILE